MATSTTIANNAFNRNAAATALVERLQSRNPVEGLNQLKNALKRHFRDAVNKSLKANKETPACATADAAARSRLTSSPTNSSPGSNIFDIDSVLLEDYLKLSPKCAELFGIWDSCMRADYSVPEKDLCVGIVAEIFASIVYWSCVISENGRVRVGQPLCHSADSADGSATYFAAVFPAHHRKATEVISITVGTGNGTSTTLLSAAANHIISTILEGYIGTGSFSQHLLNSTSQARLRTAFKLLSGIARTSVQSATRLLHQLEQNAKFVDTLQEALKTAGMNVPRGSRGEVMDKYNEIHDLCQSLVAAGQNCEGDDFSTAPSGDSNVENSILLASSPGVAVTVAPLKKTDSNSSSSAVSDQNLLGLTWSATPDLRQYYLEFLLSFLRHRNLVVTLGVLQNSKLIYPLFSKLKELVLSCGIEPELVDNERNGNPVAGTNQDQAAGNHDHDGEYHQIEARTFFSNDHASSGYNRAPYAWLLSEDLSNHKHAFVAEFLKEVQHILEEPKIQRLQKLFFLGKHGVMQLAQVWGGEASTPPSHRSSLKEMILVLLQQQLTSNSFKRQHDKKDVLEALLSLRPIPHYAQHLIFAILDGWVFPTSNFQMNAGSQTIAASENSLDRTGNSSAGSVAADAAPTISRIEQAELLSCFFANVKPNMDYRRSQAWLQNMTFLKKMFRFVAARTEDLSDIDFLLVGLPFQKTELTKMLISGDRSVMLAALAVVRDLLHVIQKQKMEVRRLEQESKTGNNEAAGTIANSNSVADRRSLKKNNGANTSLHQPRNIFVQKSGQKQSHLSTTSLQGVFLKKKTSVIQETERLRATAAQQSQLFKALVRAQERLRLFQSCLPSLNLYQQLARQTLLWDRQEVTVDLNQKSSKNVPDANHQRNEVQNSCEGNDDESEEEDDGLDVGLELKKPKGTAKQTSWSDSSDDDEDDGEAESTRKKEAKKLKTTGKAGKNDKGSVEGNHASSHVSQKGKKEEKNRDSFDICVDTTLSPLGQSFVALLETATLYYRILDSTEIDSKFNWLQLLNVDQKTTELKNDWKVAKSKMGKQTERRGDTVNSNQDLVSGGAVESNSNVDGVTTKFALLSLIVSRAQFVAYLSLVEQTMQQPWMTRDIPARTLWLETLLVLKHADVYFASTIEREANNIGVSAKPADHHKFDEVRNRFLVGRGNALGNILEGSALGVVVSAGGADEKATEIVVDASFSQKDTPSIYAARVISPLVKQLQRENSRLPSPHQLAQKMLRFELCQSINDSSASILFADELELASWWQYFVEVSALPNTSVRDSVIDCKSSNLLAHTQFFVAQIRKVKHRAGFYMSLLSGILAENVEAERADIAVREQHRGNERTLDRSRLEKPSLMILAALDFLLSAVPSSTNQQKAAEQAVQIDTYRRIATVVLETCVTFPRLRKNTVRLIAFLEAKSEERQHESNSEHAGKRLKTDRKEDTGAIVTAINKVVTDSSVALNSAKKEIISVLKEALANPGSNLLNAASLKRKRSRSEAAAAESPGVSFDLSISVDVERSLVLNSNTRIAHGVESIGELTRELAICNRVVDAMRNANAQDGSSTASNDQGALAATGSADSVHTQTHAILLTALDRFAEVFSMSTLFDESEKATSASETKKKKKKDKKNEVGREDTQKLINEFVVEVYQMLQNSGTPANSCSGSSFTMSLLSHQCWNLVLKLGMKSNQCFRLLMHLLATATGEAKAGSSPNDDGFVSVLSHVMSPSFSQTNLGTRMDASDIGEYQNVFTKSDDFRTCLHQCLMFLDLDDAASINNFRSMVGSDFLNYAIAAEDSKDAIVSPNLMELLFRQLERHPHLHTTTLASALTLCSQTDKSISASSLLTLRRVLINTALPAFMNNIQQLGVLKTAAMGSSSPLQLLGNIVHSASHLAFLESVGGESTSAEESSETHHPESQENVFVYKMLTALGDAEDITLDQFLNRGNASDNSSAEKVDLLFGKLGEHSVKFRNRMFSGCESAAVRLRLVALWIGSLEAAEVREAFTSGGGKKKTVTNDSDDEGANTNSSTEFVIPGDASLVDVQTILTLGRGIEPSFFSKLKMNYSTGKRPQKSEEWRVRFVLHAAKLRRAAVYDREHKNVDGKPLILSLIQDTKKMLNEFISLSRGIHWEVGVLADSLPNVFQALAQVAQMEQRRGVQAGVGGGNADLSDEDSSMLRYIRDPQSSICVRNLIAVDWMPLLQKSKQGPQLALANLLPDNMLVPYAIPLLVDWADAIPGLDGIVKPSMNKSQREAILNGTLSKVDEKTADAKLLLGEGKKAHESLGEEANGSEPSNHYTIHHPLVMELICRVIGRFRKERTDYQSSDRFKAWKWSAKFANLITQTQQQISRVGSSRWRHSQSLTKSDHLHRTILLFEGEHGVLPEPNWRGGFDWQLETDRLRLTMDNLELQLSERNKEQHILGSGSVLDPFPTQGGEWDGMMSSSVARLSHKDEKHRKLLQPTHVRSTQHDAIEGVYDLEYMCAVALLKIKQVYLNAQHEAKQNPWNESWAGWEDSNSGSNSWWEAENSNSWAEYGDWSSGAEANSAANCSSLYDESGAGASSATNSHTASSSSTTPLLLRAIAFGGIVQCLLLSLSCDKSSVRKHALQALSGLRELLRMNVIQSEGKNGGKVRFAFREQPQLMMLLSRTRDSIVHSEGEVPSALNPITSVFLASCVAVVLKPQHGLYKDICKLLNSAPLLQLSDIPSFNNFFQSAEFDGNGSADRKRWIVKVIRRAGPLGWVLWGKRHVAGLFQTAAADQSCEFPVWVEIIDCLSKFQLDDGRISSTTDADYPDLAGNKTSGDFAPPRGCHTNVLDTGIFQFLRTQVKRDRWTASGNNQHQASTFGLARRKIAAAASDIVCRNAELSTSSKYIHEAIALVETLLVQDRVHNISSGNDPDGMQSAGATASSTFVFDCCVRILLCLARNQCVRSPTDSSLCSSSLLSSVLAALADQVSQRDLGGITYDDVLSLASLANISGVDASARSVRGALEKLRTALSSDRTCLDGTDGRRGARETEDGVPGSGRDEKNTLSFEAAIGEGRFYGLHGAFKMVTRAVACEETRARV